MSCKRTSCPGFFKCQNSSICVPPQLLCDGINDCPNNDNKFFCNFPVLKCPINCHCLMFGIRCNNISQFGVSRDIKVYFVFIRILHSHVENTISLLKKCNMVMFLHFLNNSVVTPDQILGSLRKPSAARHIDVSHNLVVGLISPIFKKLQSLSFLNMSHNKIQQVSPFIFENCKNISIIDLANNNIIALGKYVFVGPIKISIMNMSNNFVYLVNSKAFHSSKIKCILTDSYRICCLLSESKTLCNSKPKWPFSCGRLLNNKGALVFCWFVGIIGVLINLAAFIAQKVSNRKDNSKNSVHDSGNYEKITNFICLGDGLLSICLLILAIADSIFQNHFFQTDMEWRTSFLCYLVSASFVISSILSFSMIHLMAVTRYSVVKYPYTAKCLESRYVTKQIIIFLLVSGFFPSILLVIYWITSETMPSGVLPSGLCILTGHIDRSAIPVIVNILIILLNIASTLTLPVVYIAICKVKARHKQELKSMQTTQTEETGLDKGILVSFVNVPGWLTSAILLLLTMLLHEYPYKMLLWTTILVYPIGALLNPFTYVFSKLFSQLCPRICCKHP